MMMPPGIDRHGGMVMEVASEGGADDSAATHEVTCREEDAGERLDIVIAKRLPALSRSRIQKLIRDGHARLGADAIRASQLAKAGDIIRLHVPAPRPAGVAAEQIPLEILYEDRALAVVNKPSGMVVHPGAGNSSGTLVNALLHHCTALSGIGGVERPGIVHRLDKDTSGCLVVAKTDETHRRLAAQFARRETMKLYLAVVQGRPRWNEKTAEFAIRRHPTHRQKMQAVDATAVGNQQARDARTDFRVVWPGADCSVLACRIHTGRTHQIRVHLQKLGYPVVGDRLYGSRVNAPRVMLHASQLRFIHPVNGKPLVVRAPLPEDFRKLARVTEAQSATWLPA
jgi:23S rRNA pseudouridine1911/1915/1917 synthase